MMRNLSIARKIALAVALFLLPVAFILWLLAAGLGKDILFASREVSGTVALRGLLRAEAALDRAILGGPPAGGVVTEAVSSAADAYADLGLGDDAAALARVAGGPAGGVRDKLRGLIGSVGDRSNLILDNVLDSYYATDVVLNRMPALLDGVADLRALAAAQGGSADAKAAFLVAQGGLDSVLSGLDGSMQSAVADNKDGTLAPALGAGYDALKKSAGGFNADMRGGRVVPAERFAGLVDQAAGFADAGTVALQAMLQARVAGLRRERLTDFGITGALFAAAALATMLVIRNGVVARIDRLRDSMKVLANDTDVEHIPFVEAGDEIGEMARTVRVFRENRLARLAAENATRMVNELRDKRQKAMDSHTVDFGRAMAGTMTTLTGAATEMKDSAGSLQDAAATTGAEVAVTTRAAEESSRNLSAVAAAVEEMTGSAMEIARRVADAAGIAKVAVTRTESADSAVRGLTDAAARIGAIAGAIEEIAGRTNLLALNATIEAARAGDAGRGFAVVAAEVKQLAGQTAQATRDIAEQIGEIRTATEHAAAAMEGVTSAIREVDEVAAAIAAAAEEQGATTREIAGNVGLVAQATAQTAQSMHNVSDATMRTQAMSGTVAAAAAALTQQSDALRGEVEHFLVAMRDTTHDRRRYERYPLENASALLTVEGQERSFPLIDVSMGGFAIKAELNLPAGTELAVRLPGAAHTVSARVVGRHDGMTGLFFSQNEDSRRVVAAAIARLVPAELHAAA